LRDFCDFAREFGHAADFAIIYVEEAHAADEWAFDWWGHSRISSHKELSDRAAAARVLLAELEQRDAAGVAAVYLDSMTNATSIAFGAAPERLAVLVDGRVAWLGGPGPFQYSVPAAREALLGLLRAP